MAGFPLKTHRHAKVAIDEQTRQAKNALQFLLEHRDIKERGGDDTCPITRGNTLSFMICGEDGFGHIAKDLREAKATVDIVCWGFDPGMELERAGDTWPRGIRYGELLDEITTRKENPVTVRLLIWYDDDGSKVQNNMPGLTDVPVSGLGHPIQRYKLQQNPPYKDSSRNQYCIDWWKANLPGGQSGRSGGGTNPQLQVVLRSVSKADATALRAVTPAEEDQPVSQTGFTDEKSQEEKYGTHHQKPILIDYDWDSGSKAVGYVMGLNSVTDYWDRTAHAVDDPKREVLSDKLIGDELDHELSTQQAPNNDNLATRLYQGAKDRFSKPAAQHGEGHEHYVHGRPYQDYACRVQGPALAQLHFNFENGWADALGHELPYTTPPEPPAKIPKVAGSPAHLVQIVRTQAREKEKSIKEVYFQATSSARNYIYIENQYFFYPEFVRHLIHHRQTHVSEWTSKSQKGIAEMQRLYMFIVIPHPERAEMMPRTYDSLALLGDGTSTPEQAGLADQGKLDFVYDQGKRGDGQVLDRPSADDLERTAGLEVSIARLRTSGPDADHNMAYREIYIHSKLMIIDDAFITVGSANLSQRSMSVDSEINIAATGSLYASDLRQRVFALHYGGDIKYSGDPKDLPDAFSSWNRRMSKNQDIQQAGTQAMTGFLLPFEDHRSTTTLYGSISVPSTSDTAV
ncbi:MAG: phospholipase D-like domain-containing protein [Pseudomonadota bacterium]|uniref:phospholipase D-like domain-containing protein n=2 Tax=Burkholderiales TaxID=80840 RepID=UPI0010F8D3BC|nr:phospholipase D-like domain-containing protein [Burkholderia sp. 4M9327F10]